MTWEDTNAASVVKQEPEREQAIASAVSQERDLMGSISSYNDAFVFLHRLRARLTQDHERRKLQHPEARPSRSFPLAPLTSMTPYYITLDKKALTELHSAHFRKDARVDKPNGIEDVLSVKRPGQLGASFRTDGTQAIVQYLTLTTKTLFLTKAAYDKTAAFAAEREAKRAAFADHPFFRRSVKKPVGFFNASPKKRKESPAGRRRSVARGRGSGSLEERQTQG